jgi:hypothetical protein
MRKGIPKLADGAQELFYLKIGYPTNAKPSIRWGACRW